ncbi:SDR family NAD(P)-dependent oxidoreductase [Natronosporangium hydrolyticum]|nr:SDR family oxidoreductase [Natronosporangium hydrolyticum]
MTFNRALVTGASGGIGAGFARALAAAGTEVVLVARRRDRLAELAEELEQLHQVSVEVMPTDLADSAAIDPVIQRLADSDRPVDLLVNNAGQLTNGPFAELPLAGELQQIQVNVIAPMRLTHAALPGMIKRRHGGVINVSSIGGEAPSAYGAGYCGSKAFLTLFSQSLAIDVKRHGVHVTALLPGFTWSGDRRDLSPDAAISRRAVQEPDRVAREALVAVAAGRALCVPGLRNKRAVAIGRMVPRRVMNAVLASVNATISAAPQGPPGTARPQDHPTS